MRSSIGKHFDLKKKTIGCPECSTFIATSGIGYLRHRDKRHNSQVVTPKMLQLPETSTDMVKSLSDLCRRTRGGN